MSYKLKYFIIDISKKGLVHEARKNKFRKALHFRNIKTYFGLCRMLQ